MGFWPRKLAFAAALAAAVLLGRETRLPGSELGLVWPVAAVAFVWLGVAWHARRLRLTSTALALVSTMVYLATGMSPSLAVGFAGATVLHGLVGYAVYVHLEPTGRLRDRAGLFALLLASVVASAVSALAIATALVALGDGASWLVAGQIAVRNAVSTFVLVPPALRLLRPEPTTAPRLPDGPADRGRWPAHLALVLATLLAYAVVFGVTVGLPLAFLLLPLGVWAALQLGTTLAAWHAAAAGAVAVALTLAGRGPFVAMDPTTQVLLAQLFIAVGMFLTLVLALARDERTVLLATLAVEQQAVAEQATLLETVFDSISDGVIVAAADGTFLVQNRAAWRLLGHDAGADEAERAAWVERFGVLRPDGSPWPEEELPLRRALAGHSDDAVDLVVHNPSLPDAVLVNVSARPLPGPPGRHGAVAAFHDVTVVRAAAAQVEAARDLFAAVLAAATEQAIIGTDVEGRITVFNVGAERMLGYSATEALGRSPELFHDPDEVVARAAELGVEPGFEVFVHGARAARPETRQWTYRRADGQRLQVMLTVTAMTDSAGTVTGFIGLAADVTAQRRAEQAVKDSDGRFRTAFAIASVGVLMETRAVPSGVVARSGNPALCRLLGRTPEEVERAGLLPWVHETDREALVATLAALVDGGPPKVQLELRFHRPDGELVWGLLSASAIAAGFDGSQQVLALVEDITARKHAETALRHQALHDGLTGLPNRTLLHDRLEHAITAASRSGRPAGLLYLDLDGFKAVNDTGGHASGDELLVQVTRRLSAAVRPGDTVARLGGDEFAVLCPDVDDTSRLAAIAQRVLAELGAPFPLASGTFTISASIGAALATDGLTAEQLLVRADDAMYRAKEAGKGRIAVQDTQDSARAARAARLLPELALALERDELLLHGQPVVDLATGRTVAVEMLLRWQHPTRGLLHPAEFLAVAEASPMMLAIGRRVLDLACQQAASWTETLGASAPDVHVNVSGRQLEAGNVVGDVMDALHRYGLPADRLVLELTETYTPLLADSLRRDLQRLRDRGVRLAIDDVGTGYSSLTRITELPVDMLKINISFVRGLGVEPGCDAVVRAVLSMGQALGLSVVAEGVETPHQAHLLARFGCDTAQGYLFSPPRPERALLQYLDAPAAPVPAPVD